MVVGILTVILSVPGSDSLKDKRHVIKSILDVSRNRFNVSASEVDYLDSHRTAGLAFACVSNEASFVDKVLSKVMEHIESNPMCEVIDSRQELL